MIVIAEAAVKLLAKVQNHKQKTLKDDDDDNIFFYFLFYYDAQNETNYFTTWVSWFDRYALQTWE